MEPDFESRTEVMLSGPQASIELTGSVGRLEVSEKDVGNNVTVFWTMTGAPKTQYTLNTYTRSLFVVQMRDQGRAPEAVISTFGFSISEASIVALFKFLNRAVGQRRGLWPITWHVQRNPNLAYV
jgi:hypothetical protein